MTVETSLVGARAIFRTPVPSHCNEQHARVRFIGANRFGHLVSVHPWKPDIENRCVDMRAPEDGECRRSVYRLVHDVAATAKQQRIDFPRIEVVVYNQHMPRCEPGMEFVGIAQSAGKHTMY